MKIEIRLFAAAKAALDTDTVSIEVSDSATIAELRRELATKHPELTAILASSRFAVNHDYVGDDFVIGEGKELALIPPVSGG